MRILSRYVLREFMVPFLYCLIGFLAIYMLFDTIESAGKIMEVSPPLDEDHRTSALAASALFWFFRGLSER